MAIYSVGRRRVIIALLLTSALLLTLDLRGNAALDRVRDGFSRVMQPVEDATEVAGVREGGWGWAACAQDFDNDGHPQLHLSPHRQMLPVDPLCGHVFGKIAEVHIQSFLLNALNAFRGQEAHLTVPGTGMSIAFKTMVFNDPGPVHERFTGSFFATDSNRYDFHDPSLMNTLNIASSTILYKIRDIGLWAAKANISERIANRPSSLWRTFTFHPGA